MKASFIQFAQRLNPDVIRRTAWGVACLLVLILLFNSVYILNENDWGFLANGRVVIKAGPHFKWPWQDVRKFARGIQTDQVPFADQPTRQGERINGLVSVAWRTASTEREFLHRATLPYNEPVIRKQVKACVTEQLNAELSQRTLAEVLGGSSEESPATMEVSVVAGVAARCQEELAQRFGIELVDLSIVRLNMDGPTQARLFRPAAAAQKIAAEKIVQQAQAEADAIRSQAAIAKAKIETDAIEQSAAKRMEALIEADRIIRTVESRDPELAALVKAINGYKSAMDPDATLVLEGGSAFFRRLERQKKSPASQP